MISLSSLSPDLILFPGSARLLTCFPYTPHRIFLLQFSIFFPVFSLENCHYFIYTINTQKAEVFIYDRTQYS